MTLFQFSLQNWNTSSAGGGIYLYSLPLCILILYRGRVFWCSVVAYFIHLHAGESERLDFVCFILHLSSPWNYVYQAILTWWSQLMVRCSPVSSSVRNQNETILESVTGHALVRFLPWSTTYSYASNLLEFVVVALNWLVAAGVVVVWLLPLWLLWRVVMAWTINTGERERDWDEQCGDLRELPASQPAIS